MINNNSNKYAISVLLGISLFIFYSIIKINSPMGLDFNNSYDYLFKTGDIGEYNLYTLKELISWELIRTTSILNLSSNIKIIIIDLLFFLIYLIFFNRSKFLPICYPIILITPVFVLLSFNIIRQYVSILFIMFFIYQRYSKKNYNLNNYLFVVAAFLSHNSSILIFIFYGLMEFLLKRYKITTILTLSAFGALLFHYFYPSIPFINLVQDNSLQDTPLRFLYYFTYLAFLLFIFYKNNIFYKINFLYLIYSILFYIIDIPIWMINRFTITFSAVLIIYSFVNLKKFNLINIYKVFFLFVLSVFYFILHNGVLSMVFQ